MSPIYPYPSSPLALPPGTYSLGDRWLSAMNCLILASLETQYMQGEVQELSNTLAQAHYIVQLLQTGITSLELYRVLGGQTIGLVWVSSHASTTGFTFGTILITPRELGMFVSQAKTHSLVLNTCYSIEHVSIIQQQSPQTSVLATINPNVLDQDAWTNALYLGRRLAETMDLETAYREILATGGSDYRWFPALTQTAEVSGMAREEDKKGHTELQQTVARLESTISRLVRALQGDSMLGQRGLVDTVRDLDTRVRRLEHDVGDEKLVLTRWGAAAVTVLFVVLAGIILFMAYRLGGYNVGTVDTDLNFLPVLSRVLIASLYKLLGVPPYPLIQ